MKAKLIVCMKYTILSVVAVITIFPILFTVVNSFFPSGELMNTYFSSLAVRIKLIPDKVSLEQYYQVFFRRPTFIRMFWNSIFMTGCIVIGQVFVSSLAAFGFAKLKFPFRDKIFILFVILLVIPPQALLVSNYIALDFLKLIGSYSSIILPGIFSAFGICLLRQYMRYVPNETCDAAKIDGANAFQIYRHIVMPQCKAGVASLIVLTFLDNWNMIEQPLIFLKDSLKYPMSIYLARSGDFSVSFAFSIVFMIPPLLVFFFYQEDFVKGIKL